MRGRNGSGDGSCSPSSTPSTVCPSAPSVCLLRSGEGCIFSSVLRRAHPLGLRLPSATKNAKTAMQRGVGSRSPARPCSGPPLLVVGEFEYLLDVAGAPTEAVRHVERRDALVAPPQYAPFNGTQPVGRFRRGSSWEIREHKDTFDEVLTAVEPATNLCWHHALSGEPADPSFERSKVSGCGHQCAGYCGCSLSAAARPSFRAGSAC